MIFRNSLTLLLLLFHSFPSLAYSDITSNDDYNFIDQERPFTCSYREPDLKIALSHNIELGNSAPSPVDRNAVLWECGCSIRMDSCTQEGHPSEECSVPGQKDGTPYAEFDEDYHPACLVRGLLDPAKEHTEHLNYLIGFTAEEVNAYEKAAREIDKSLRQILEPIAYERCAKSCQTTQESFKISRDFINRHCTKSDLTGDDASLTEDIMYDSFYCAVPKPRSTPTPAPEEGNDADAADSSELFDTFRSVDEGTSVITIE